MMIALILEYIRTYIHTIQYYNMHMYIHIHTTVIHLNDATVLVVIHLVFAFFRVVEALLVIVLWSGWQVI